MGKNLLAFIDGTWNGYVIGQDAFTNIFRLADESKGVKNQHSYYSQGVGVNEPWPYRYINGITGKGVFALARDIWQNLSNNYIPGDHVFIFGFSRGAFAARHLASMITRYGFPNFGIEDNFKKYIAECERPIKKFAEPVHFLGLFDCVPGNHLYRWFRKGSRFNGPVLEPGIRHFRHAISKDERRFSFEPIIFETADHHESFKQVWFPGFHADIGGGPNQASGLAAFARWWMMREAYHLGLRFQIMEGMCARRHKFGSAMSVVQSADPDQEGVCSDYLTTKLGLQRIRAEMTRADKIGSTPDFFTLTSCDYCNRDLFDALSTPYGIKRANALLGR